MILLSMLPLGTPVIVLINHNQCFIVFLAMVSNDFKDFNVLLAVNTDSSVPTQTANTDIPRLNISEISKGTNK